jgi:predicted nucleic acid-binding protein
MKPRVYIDTSVVGGYFDEEFDADTKKFFLRIFNEDFIIYFSEISETELSLAPDHVKDLKKKIPKTCYRYIELDEESKYLAQVYIDERILGQSSYNDAYHIALATVNRLDVVVSWNFKHIVNFDKIKLFNSVNLKLGYPVIDIRSPLEFIDHENDD